MNINSPMVELCLACSGSALSGSSSRRRYTTAESKCKSFVLESLHTGEAEDDSIFRTQCCNRPICVACLRANPRLRRYRDVPCFACPSSKLVTSSSNVVSSGMELNSNNSLARLNQSMKVKGALNDRNVFVVGDDEDSGDSGDDGINNFSNDGLKRVAYSGILATAPTSRRHSQGSTASPLPAYSEIVASDMDSGSTTEASRTVASEPATASECEMNRIDTSAPRERPNIHYIQRDDTIRGLALRYGVDARTLCRQNNLPPSTVTTTPHLLHTRRVLKLPAGSTSATSDSRSRDGEEMRHERDAKWAREREIEKTAKRLQLITKEIDWDVARVYAILAQDQDDEEPTRRLPHFRSPDEKTLPTEKEKSGERSGTGRRATSAEVERAVDAYLEDDTWEAAERAAARGPSTTAGRSGLRNCESVKTWF